MSHELGRRAMLGAAGAMAVVGALGTAAQETAPKLKIIGVSCSLRKGKTTAAALALCLAAAKEKDPDMETELIELADLSIPAQLAAGLPLRAGETDDFPEIAKKLADPAVAGIIIGSPVYFSNLSALCKAFLERCMTFRKDDFKLRNKVAGVVAVGGSRNGGQELTIQAIQASLMGQDMILVGDGKPSGRIGAALWNVEDSIEADTVGQETARNLGARVAEVARSLAG
jgi:multimeric flavodoxin WrbA